MKKLMIALAAVAVAAGVQAASFTWANTGGASNGVIYNGAGTSAKLAEGTVAYLFCVDDITQSGLLESLRAGDAITKYAIADATTALNSASKIATTDAFSYGTYVEGQTTTYDFFWATLVDDKVLISQLVEDQIAQKSGTTPIAFSGSKTWSDVNKGDAAFSAAGWYNTVPEPTSGLLLLLGVAGLALRRRRA